MSRIPAPSRGTPSVRGTPRKAAQESPTKLTPGGTARTRTTSSIKRATTPVKSTTISRRNDAPKVPVLDDPADRPLSIKEAIALKRAEAKKAQAAKSTPLDDFSTLEDAIPDAPPPEEEDILGRPPLRETIEKAKQTGSVNLSTRGLQCIPSALFELHLGVNPVPLPSVPDEPPLPPAVETGRVRKSSAWYEGRDLEILKAWGNEIVEIQPEIALFGSLKSVDLHKNKIAMVPKEFADLAALTTLDLSHNALTSLPPNIFSLPALSNLNISHNRLTSLPFSAPFASAVTKKPTFASHGFLGEPAIERSTVPLPKLAIFDASNNDFSAVAIDLDLPKALINLDLSSNHLDSEGPEACSKLLAKLATLPKLKVLRFERADISDGIFDSVADSHDPFPSLSVLDFGYTKVTEGGARSGLKGLKKELTFEVTNDEPPSGTVCIIVGKKLVREAWEIEAERQAKSRADKKAAEPLGLDWENAPPSVSKAQKAALKPVVKPVPIVKEAWEIEAEQGLLTEGGRRRARAAAAAAKEIGIGEPPRQSSPTKMLTLADPQYYSNRTDTLTLPASVAAKPGHARAISLASTAFEKLSAPRASDVALPTATLPLSLIASQSFAQNLKVLVLNSRRLDRSFTLPAASPAEPLLPRLEELNLEGCNLGDSVSVSIASAEETIAVPSMTRPTLPLIAELFPSVRNLNLAYNQLTAASLTDSTLSGLLTADGNLHKGLKQLHLRGNRIAELDGFQALAVLFKGNRDVPGWTLEELDLRDNEISKLPAELGLLPLDSFLVDGNLFRVPARRVWEREGTKGLLTWLRLRLE
ncbi:unnamed protein product [Mycena citricolor]|uniref:Leucine-rich repeat-containing protein 40 n=1 Tax=Mycena citricolor TaxID=2018698 RepID=A0AAD2GSY0_9AGAR|nr:unnamed protein product [Mycena citricolor]CAK5275608.1 unnamed protein product [Mycena citricolor]